MDQKEQKQLQPLGICERLYNFIIETLASQAQKRVTLGRPMNQVDCTNDPTVHPINVCEQAKNIKESGNSTSLRSLLNYDNPKDDKELPRVQTIFDAGESQEEKVIRLAKTTSQAKAPKKMVSINDKVEMIDKIMKKRKKSKSFDRSSSLVSEEDEINKPLRSILKVGSDLNKNPDI